MLENWALTFIGRFNVRLALVSGLGGRLEGDAYAVPIRFGLLYFS